MSNTVIIRIPDQSGIWMMLDLHLVVEWSDVRMVLSILDHFINKSVIKRNFFKHSRLEVEKLSVRFSNVLNIQKLDKLVRFPNSWPFCYHLKTGPENDHSKTGQSVFGWMLTVL